MAYRKITIMHRLAANRIILLLTALTSYFTGLSQAIKKNNTLPQACSFVAGENIVFYDDFNTSKEGIFPKHWKMLNNTGSGSYVTRAAVAIIDSIPALLFTNGNGRFAKPVWDDNLYKTNKDNYWTFEFDFKFETASGQTYNCVGLEISSVPNRPDFSVNSSISSYSDSCKVEIIDGRREPFSVNYPGVFDKAGWHHFAIVFTKQTIFCCIDHFRLLSTQNPNYYLPNIELYGRAKVAIKNFKIARTDSLHPVANATRLAKKEFTDTLLKEKKFVTHAINFDKNKAIVKPESITFINKLAIFLKANPPIKLEIDGYTDSDGSSYANKQLSLHRADAIKKELISFGVDGSRLTTKGFGATKPIDTNSTPEGKAINRRVELLILSR